MRFSTFKLPHILPLLTVSASKAGTALLSIATAAIIANIYGQIGLGIFALLRVAPTVLMVLTDPGFSHAIPFLSSNQKVDERAIVGSGIYVYLAIAALQIIAWILLSPLIHQHLLHDLPMIAIYAASILAPLQSIMILIVNILRARYCYNLANSIFLLVELTLLLLAAISATWVAPDLAILVYLLIISSALSVIVGIGFIFWTGERGSPRLDLAIVLEGVRFGIKSQIGNAFQILNYRLDHLLLGLFLTPEKVAVYFVATKSIEFFRFFTASIVFVFEPVFAAQLKTDAKARVRKMLLPILLANIFLLSVGIILAPVIYPLVFGNWSTAANDPLMILGVGLAVSGANSLFGAYFLGQGHPGMTTLASLAGLIVTVVLALLLIPMFGIIGAAVTSSIAYTVITLVYVLVFLRNMGRTELKDNK